MEEIVRVDLTQNSHGLAILKLLNDYALDPMGGGAPLSEFVLANLVGRLRDRPTFHGVLAFVDGQPAGLINCFEGFSTFAAQSLLNIHDVVVSKEYRGRGLFKKMYWEVETIAENIGACKLTLEVLEGNAVAQSAYRSVGFSGYELDPEIGQALFWQKKLA
ncbi:MAG: GNAT family N-acetyltransferase [Alkalinema sp. RU_4_3]|nr:GNAT family N-acetyltransferase [Alkalinema sp. RU_4_3]